MTGVDERAGAAAVRPVNMRHWPGNPGRPALALHCMMGSGAGWGPIAEGLGGRVDLHALDLPGHGRSPRLAAIAPGEIELTRMPDSPSSIATHLVK